MDMVILIKLVVWLFLASSGNGPMNLVKVWLVFEIPMENMGILIKLVVWLFLANGRTLFVIIISAKV